ncbi:MAG: twin-arginine translocase subunit TatC, partial [Pirellulales bacterium]|nr:twin-arginine translocase subunit TatC [Pirellulales bacterium]
IKASLITGLVLSSPWVFYQIWMFVAAGLYPHEKKYVHIYLPFSILLFMAGASLAFFFVFEPVLDFLFGFYRWLGIEPDQRIGPWLNFVILLPLGFGVSFQLPLVMLFLERIGVMTVEAYIEKWRIAILAIFVISMLLTPADPTSMLMMAVPLSFLYVGGVLLCKFLPRKKNPFEE